MRSASLDRFIAIMRGLAERAKEGAPLTEALYHAPRRRLDETQAARKPVLRWRGRARGPDRSKRGGRLLVRRTMPAVGVDSPGRVG